MDHKYFTPFSLKYFFTSSILLLALLYVYLLVLNSIEILGIFSFFLEISRDGETWKISFKTAIKSNNSTFKVGQDFEEESPNGKKVKVWFDFFDESL